MASVVRPLGHLARPLLLLLLLASNVSAASAQSHFNCLDGPGNIYHATVIVTSSQAPDINGVPLTNGSEIASFSSDPVLTDDCVGGPVWENDAASITIWGDDNLTVLRNGLVSGETIQFRVWDRNAGVEYAIDPSDTDFLVGNGVYSHDAVFVISRLSITTEPASLRATGDIATTDEDAPVLIDILANDSGGPSALDPATVSTILAPQHGYFSGIDPVTGALSYVPFLDFAGSDTFSYTVSNLDGSVSEEVQVEITVNALNDAPRVVSSPATIVTPGSEYVYQIEINEVDGDAVSVSIESGPPWLALDFSDIIVLKGTPSPENIGAHPIVLSFSDGAEAATQEFTLKVSDSSEPLTTASTLRTPAWGAINIPTDTQFSWEPITWASTYHLQVAHQGDVNFDNPVLDDVSIDGSNATTSPVHYTAPVLPQDAFLIWRVRGQNGSGFSPWSDASQYRTGSTASSTPTEVGDELPSVADLFQNYPNPFNPKTTIAFEIPASAAVSVTIYDLMGREVARLLDKTLSAGRHEVQWDAGNQASGLYLYRLRAGSFVKSRTLSLIK